MINGFGIRGWVMTAISTTSSSFRLLALWQPRKSPGQCIIGGRPVPAFTCHPHEMT
jgi:hypothetical protein